MSSEDEGQLLSENEEQLSSEDEGHLSLEEGGQPFPEDEQQSPPMGKGKQPARDNGQSFSCGLLCPETFPSAEAVIMVTLVQLRIHLAHPRTALASRPLLEVRILSRPTSVLQCVALARGKHAIVKPPPTFCDARTSTAPYDGPRSCWLGWELRSRC